LQVIQIIPFATTKRKKEKKKKEKKGERNPIIPLFEMGVPIEYNKLNGITIKDICHSYKPDKNTNSLQ
jgi:hypothetical protein